MRAITIGSAGVLVALVAASPSAQQKRPVAPPREAHFTNDPRYAWGELQIAINPKNPNNLAVAIVGLTICGDRKTGDCEALPSTFSPPVPGLPAGSFGRRERGFYENPDFTAIFIYYSMDGGRTWSRSRLPAHPRGLPRLTSQGDPGLTAGPDGTFYASWDANDWGTPEKTLPAAGVPVSMSRDGGKTWSEPVLSGVPVDGPKLTADLITGDIYAAASTYRGPRSTGNPSLPLDPTNSRWLVVSKNGVKWTEPQAMGGVGSHMSAAHGIFATGFATTATATLFGSPNSELCGSAPAPCAVFQTTTDAGRNWSRHILPVAPGAAGALGQGGAVTVAADPTQRGRFSVGVQVGSAFHVLTTNDSGNTWGKPTIVSTDASRTPFHSAMAYSRQGVLGLMWRSRAAGTAAPSAPGAPSSAAPPTYNVWAVISRDKGARFSRAVQLSGADSPGGNASGDDYSHLVLSSGYLYSGWADWRPGTRGGYVAAVPLHAFTF